MCLEGENNQSINALATADVMATAPSPRLVREKLVSEEFGRNFPRHDTRPFLY